MVQYYSNFTIDRYMRAGLVCIRRDSFFVRFSSYATTFSSYCIRKKNSISFRIHSWFIVVFSLPLHNTIFFLYYLYGARSLLVLFFVWWLNNDCCGDSRSEDNNYSKSQNKRRKFEKIIVHVPTSSPPFKSFVSHEYFCLFSSEFAHSLARSSLFMCVFFFDTFSFVMVSFILSATISFFFSVFCCVLCINATKCTKFLCCLSASRLPRYYLLVDIFVYLFVFVLSIYSSSFFVFFFSWFVVVYCSSPHNWMNKCWKSFSFDVETIKHKQMIFIMVKAFTVSIG